MTEEPAIFPPDPVRSAKVEGWFTQLRDRICTAFEAILMSLPPMVAWP